MFHTISQTLSRTYETYTVLLYLVPSPDLRLPLLGLLTQVRCSQIVDYCKGEHASVNLSGDSGMISINLLIREVDQMKSGVEIVVATPGRLIDVVTVSGGRVASLLHVSYIAVDEVLLPANSSAELQKLQTSLLVQMLTCR